ncbi:hypothetical protein Bpfe_016098, partial [Biomphalaria pfeifferi]
MRGSCVIVVCVILVTSPGDPWKRVQASEFAAGQCGEKVELTRAWPHSECPQVCNGRASLNQNDLDLEQADRNNVLFEEDIHINPNKRIILDIRHEFD